MKHTRIVHVIVGTKADAAEFARVLELPRASVISSGQIGYGALHGRVEHAVAAPPFGERLIDLEPRILFAALSAIDMHNRIASATLERDDDERRMDAVHRSRATRHSKGGRA